MEMRIAQSIIILNAHYNLSIVFKYMFTSESERKIIIIILEDCYFGSFDFDTSVMSELKLKHVKTCNQTELESFKST